MRKKYRWKCPHEWLDYKLRTEWPTDSVRWVGIIPELINRMGDNELQDIFESDMAADGYFEPLTENMSPRGQLQEVT